MLEVLKAAEKQHLVHAKGNHPNAPPPRRQCKFIGRSFHPMHLVHKRSLAFDYLLLKLPP